MGEQSNSTTIAGITAVPPSIVHLCTQSADCWTRKLWFKPCSLPSGLASIEDFLHEHDKERKHQHMAWMTGSQLTHIRLY